MLHALTRIMISGSALSSPVLMCLQQCVWVLWVVMSGSYRQAVGTASVGFINNDPMKSKQEPKLATK